MAILCLDTSFLPKMVLCYTAWIVLSVMLLNPKNDVACTFHRIAFYFNSMAVCTWGTATFFCIFSKVRSNPLVFINITVWSDACLMSWSWRITVFISSLFQLARLHLCICTEITEKENRLFTCYDVLSSSQMWGHTIHHLSLLPLTPEFM